MMKRLLLGVFACACLLATTAFVWTQSASAQSDGEGVIYELRTYTTADGKLDDLHRRFRDHTMRLFEKRGMKNVIYWTPADQDNTLVYVLSHKSQAAAEASWKAFIGDPEWQEAYKASREDGPIVTNVERQFLTVTDYSPIK